MASVYGKVAELKQINDATFEVEFADREGIKQALQAEHMLMNLRGQVHEINFKEIEEQKKEESKQKVPPK